MSVVESKEYRNNHQSEFYLIYNVKPVQLLKQGQW